MRADIMKKISAAATAFVIALTLCGCGDKPSDKDAGSENAQTNESHERVTVTLPTKTETTAAESVPDEKDDDQEETLYTPAMWKVTSPEGNSIYMMGSMHALKEECYPLPDYIESAYRQADILAVECDITDAVASTAASLKYAANLTYPEGDSAELHLDAGEWDEISSYIADHGLDPEDYKQYQLWYLSQQLEAMAMTDAELDASCGIDQRLLNDAHESGKEIFEVESIDMQMELFVTLDEAILSATLKGYCAENRDDIKQGLIDLYGYWRSGDIDSIADEGAESETDSEDLSKESQQLLTDFNKILLDDRNVGMAEAAKQLMKDGKNVFYLVGAAHFGGEAGILSLLEKDGYTVERVEK